jgi:Protein of unknown function, DUF547
MLALPKFKITEEHKKFALENPEPMTLFALSCGMFSSPAVRLPSYLLILSFLFLCFHDSIFIYQCIFQGEISLLNMDQVQTNSFILSGIFVLLLVLKQLICH